MRNFVLCLLSLLLSGYQLFATDIPSGTKITVRTTTTVSSDRSTFDDPVDMILTSDLVVHGAVIASEGATVHGVVASLSPSEGGRAPIPGTISLRLETVDTPEGTYHLSTNNYTRQGSGRSRSAIPNGGGISIDSVGGIQRQSPFPNTSGVTLSTPRLEAIIPEQTVITFKTSGVSKPVPHK